MQVETVKALETKRQNQQLKAGNVPLRTRRKAHERYAVFKKGVLVLHGSHGHEVLQEILEVDIVRASMELCLDHGIFKRRRIVGIIM